MKKLLCLLLAMTMLMGSLFVLSACDEKDKDKDNTKMFKHITAITCVIKPLVDCFLNNPSPVIYLHVFINRSVVITASCCLPCSWMPIITSNPSPVTSVVRKPEWITYFFSLPWWRQDWANVRTLYSTVMEVQPSTWLDHHIFHERVQPHQLQTRDMFPAYLPTCCCEVGQGREGEFG